MTRTRPAGPGRLAIVFISLATVAVMLSMAAPGSAAPRQHASTFASYYDYLFSQTYPSTPGIYAINRSCPGCDLSGRSYYGKTMPSVNFAGARVDNVDFDHATMTDANLTNIYWTEDSFSARHANLAGANLQGAQLALAEMAGVNLTGTNLRYVDAYEVKWENAILDNADLRWMTGSLQYAPFVSLHGANLTGANFDSATLSGATLTNAVLAGADLDAAEVSGADMTGATGTPSTVGTWWNNTICPDGTNSNDNADTCVGHFLP